MNNVHFEKVVQLLRRAGFSFEEARSVSVMLVEIGFFEAPASAKHHLAYEGGLAEHSINVCEKLVELTEANEILWGHIRSPFIVGLLHDLCKVDAYVKTDKGYEYNKDCMLVGHGDKSAILARNLIPDLTAEEMLCIRYHMGAYYKEDWNGFDASIRAYPTVLWTHMADMLASKVMEGMK